MKKCKDYMRVYDENVSCDRPCFKESDLCIVHLTHRADELKCNINKIQKEAEAVISEYEKIMKYFDGKL